MSKETVSNDATAAMVPVSIDGWTLFRDRAGCWIKDLDLAVRAEMAKPRDVRSTIEKCIGDGVLLEAAIGAGTAGANNPAYFRKVTDVVVSGKGREQKVAAYYLNREAALHVLMRLRTPKAVQLQVAVVKVFFLAVDGHLAPAAPALPPAPPPGQLMAPERKAELLLEIAREWSPAVSDEARDVVRAHAAALLAGTSVTPLLPRLPEGGRWWRASEMAKEFCTTPFAVGRAISALGLRGQPEHFRTIMDHKPGTTEQVACYLWSPAVHDAVGRHFAATHRSPSAAPPEGQGSLFKGGRT
jgi:hypothetical protein